MLKIRRCRDRFIFNMGIPIPGKDGLHIDTGPWRLLFNFELTRQVCHNSDAHELNKKVDLFL